MSVDWTWAVPSNHFKVDTHEEVVQLCRTAGLGAIEGWPAWFDGSTAEAQAHAAIYRDAGIDIATFHLPLKSEDDIASPYEYTRREAVKTMLRWMERAAEVTARAVILHPTNCRQAPLVSEDDVELAFKQFGRSMEQLIPEAERLDLTLAVENMQPTPGFPGSDRLGSKPEHFKRIAATFDHPRVGFCLDTGHALIAMGDPQRAHEIMYAMGDRIAAFHLADNSGDRDLHLAPGRGNVAWEPVFQHAAAIGYEHPICIETAPFAPGPPFSDDAWQGMVGDVRALAERALAAV